MKRGTRKQFLTRMKNARLLVLGGKEYIVENIPHNLGATIKIERPKGTARGFVKVGA